jgi:transmembrane sensor
VDPAAIDSNLLTRHLTGETDEAEARAVEAWAAASEANRGELERMRRIWELSGTTTDIPPFNVDAAFANVEARIADAEGKGRIRSIGSRNRWMPWLAAAAVIAGLVFAAQLFWRSPQPEMLFADASPVELVLKDSSNVVLAAGSRMDVLMNARRHVTLQGQAYFEVKRDEQRPFIVETGDVRVSVLGTAFTVIAYDTSIFVLVRVRSGLVRVEGGKDSVELKAGEHARYHRSRHFLERVPAAPAEVWGLRILQFENATLHQVAEQLQRIYHVQIDLRNPAIMGCTYTAEFDNEEITAILRVIADTFGLELRQAGKDHFMLDGEGCL